MFCKSEYLSPKADKMREAVFEVKKTTREKQKQKDLTK